MLHDNPSRLTAAGCPLERNDLVIILTYLFPYTYLHWSFLPTYRFILFKV